MMRWLKNLLGKRDGPPSTEVQPSRPWPTGKGGQDEEWWDGVRTMARAVGDTIDEDGEDFDMAAVYLGGLLRAVSAGDDPKTWSRYVYGACCHTMKNGRPCGLKRESAMHGSDVNGPTLKHEYDGPKVHDFWPGREDDDDA